MAFEIKFVPKPQDVICCWDSVTDVKLYQLTKAGKKLEAAGLKLRFVNRDKIRATFYASTGRGNDSTKELSSILDPYGCVLEHLLDGPHSGSGYWARDLNRGNFFLIENPYIKKNMTGLDEIISHLLTSADSQMPPANFIIVRLLKPHFIKIFRDLGFRRIGDSDFFCRRLGDGAPVFEDYDPPANQSVSELETFRMELERKRCFKTSSSGTERVSIHFDFQGYTDAQAAKMLRLSGLEKPYTRAQELRAKWGCTCGLCKRGFISPRMLFTLQRNGEKYYSIMHKNTTDLQTGMTPFRAPPEDSPDLVIMSDVEIPQQLFLEDKQLRFAFCYIWRYIQYFTNVGEVPTAGKIYRAITGKEIQLPDEPCPCCGQRDGAAHDCNIMRYLELGGSAEAVLTGLIRISRRSDEKTGDNTFHLDATDVAHGRVSELPFTAEWQAMPRCRNDTEYELVHRLLCKT